MRIALIVCLVTFTFNHSTAAQKEVKVIGRVFSPSGTLLQRGPGQWRMPELFDPVHEFDTLMALPGARAELQFKEGDARLSLRGNLPELSSSAVLESMIELRQESKFDVDFFLVRGRVVLENHNDKGPMRARVRIRSATGEQGLDIVLQDHTTAVALELHSRWPKGAPFLPKPTKGHEPAIQLLAWVLKGKALIEVDGSPYAASAPSALDISIQPDRREQGPFALQKLPDWTTTPRTPEAKAALAAVEVLRKRLAEDGIRSPANVSDKDEPMLRRVALYGCAALGEPAPVLAGLADTRSPELRAAAITAFEHLSGQGSGYDVQLYNRLQVHGYTTTEAGLVLSLLHGFSNRDARRAETYTSLIQHLAHAKIGIRDLARRNLYLLAPEGHTIFFNAAGGSAHYADAQAAWRKLIPPGQIPQSLK